MKLPEKDYFTYEDLTERWNCKPSYISHLVLRNKLPVWGFFKGTYSSFKYEIEQDEDDLNFYDLKPSENMFITGYYQLTNLIYTGAIEFYFQHFVSSEPFCDDQYCLIEDLNCSPFNSTNIQMLGVFMRADVLHVETQKTNREVIYPWGEHRTNLLDQLESAAIKFWKNYDPSEPETAPTNEQVSEWLKQQGVSKRIAETMATILRANDLQMGRRK